jgi:cytochrome c biogenesis protein CcdA
MKRILIQSTTTVIVFCTFVTVAHATGDVSLENPLNPQFSSIPNFIAGFLKVLVMIALPIITVYFVLAGYKFVTAGGDTTKISEARRNFVNVVLGAALVLGAWVLATLIGGTVTQLTG